MNRIITLALFMFVSVYVWAQQPASSTGFKPSDSDQNSKKTEKGKNYNVNYDVSNQEAYFQAGEDSLFRLLYHKINLPETAVKANLNSNAMIGFQVNFDGKVSGAYSISKVGYGIDEQLIEALSNLSFKPATQGSIPYRSEVIIEIPIKASYLNGLKN
jgi:hypothetical protein